MLLSTPAILTKDQTESVKAVLGRHTKILVKYLVKLETRSDKSENRILVFTPYRIYILTAKIPTKIECHFPYLDIQVVESKKATQFSLVTSDRSYNFTTTGDAGNFSSNADVILTDLATAIKQIFPTVPLKYIIKRIDIKPTERETIFSEELRPPDPRNIGPCGGFSVQYGCLCDFHGVPYRDEVAWDIDTIYLSHDSRILNLRDFDHLEAKDLMAIASTLEYNTFFRGFKASHMRLSSETLERLLHVLKRSIWLEELHLEGLGLKAEFIHKLAVSVITNNNPALRTIDLSHNVIEDKGAIHLSGPIAKVSKGLCKLCLAHCGLTAKGVNQISHSLSLNGNISNSLTYMDLSSNNLKDDITNLYNFLAQPNVLEYLDLSSTDIILENLFGALLRGCATNLAYLNVAHNSFTTKKSKEIPPSFKQFFTSTLSLKHLNMAGCKLPIEALKNLLLGLACNESTAGLHLDLSSSALGLQGAHVLESCIHGVRVLQSLNISDNNLDNELAAILSAISKNPSIRTLNLCRTLTNIKMKHIPIVMDALVNLIQKDEFPIMELILSENKLKNDIHDFINALGSNQSLLKLDISGNYMGDVGARLLAKALQINNKLRVLCLDKNNITLQGYADLVYALEYNYSVQTIPFPVFDVAPLLKNHSEKADTMMRTMQELLQRNVNGGIKRNLRQSLRLEQSGGYIMSPTHQLVDKLLSEAQISISNSQNNNDNSISNISNNNAHNSNSGTNNSINTTTNTNNNCSNETNNNNSSLTINVQRLIHDAENWKQLLPKLQESVHYATHPIEMKLTCISNELHRSIHNYLEETLDSMLRTGIEQCPKALDNQIVMDDLRKMLKERLSIPQEFLKMCLLNNAGSEIINRINEIEQSFAATISDRAIEEVLEALKRYRCGLGISDNNSTTGLLNEDGQTPDIVRSRSNHDSKGLMLQTGGVERQSVFRKKGLETQTATPHMAMKRRTLTQKIRPQSVMENLNLSQIPDLLETPSSTHCSTSQITQHTNSSIYNHHGNNHHHHNHHHNHNYHYRQHHNHSATASSSLIIDSTNQSHLSDEGGCSGGIGGIDEYCDSITELPSASFQLQHLVKGRPKRAKTRAPTRPLKIKDNGSGAPITNSVGISTATTIEIGEGLEQFFRPGSVTPTNLTPLVSPTSDECSYLSFADSPTISRNDNGQITSEETTPILEERSIPVKFEYYSSGIGGTGCDSPLLEGNNGSIGGIGAPCSVRASRSRSTDNLERYTPIVGRKSPLVKMIIENGGAKNVSGTVYDNEALISSKTDEVRVLSSPSTDSVRSQTASISGGKSILRTPIMLPKPRPWSVAAGNENKLAANGSAPGTEQGTLPGAGMSISITGNSSMNASSEIAELKGLHDNNSELDETKDVQLLPFGQNTGGSIIGITPGIAMMQTSSSDNTMLALSHSGKR